MASPQLGAHLCPGAGCGRVPKAANRLPSPTPALGRQGDAALSVHTPLVGGATATGEAQVLQA
jgi:hypothetical protein